MSWDTHILSHCSQRSCNLYFWSLPWESLSLWIKTVHPWRCGSRFDRLLEVIKSSELPKRPWRCPMMCTRRQDTLMDRPRVDSLQRPGVIKWDYVKQLGWKHTRCRSKYSTGTEFDFHGKSIVSLRSLTVCGHVMDLMWCVSKISCVGNRYYRVTRSRRRRVAKLPWRYDMLKWPLGRLSNRSANQLCGLCRLFFLNLASWRAMYDIPVRV